MLTKPWPAAPPRIHVEAGAVVADLESEHTVGLDDRDRRSCVLAGVLAGVLERLEGAEVDGGLDVVAVTSDIDEIDGRRERGSAGRRRERVGEPARHEQRREDAVGERPELGDRRLDVTLDLVDHRHRIGGVVLDGVARQAELDGERHEVLLGPVVEVAFELAPLAVAGGHDAGAGVLQLLVADAQFVETGLESGVELHVVQRQPDLAGDLGEDGVLGSR